jgi:hypothetical protein
MKKNIIISAMVLALAGGVSSCSDFLDKEVDLTQQADNIFSDFNNTRGFLANIYTYLPDAFHGYTDGQYLNASKDAMTDNAVSYWDVHYYHQVHNDAFDATNHQFATYYYNLDTKGIRACNQFLKNARTDVIGNADKAGDDNRLGDRWIAEARAIRAILTFDMASWFGDVPIFVTGDNEPYIMNTSDPMPDRTPFVQVMDWIVSECDAVKNALPFRYANEDENWGRINGAAVYALKSRALLYKASPLHNTSNDQSWWQAAAQAAEDFINANSALGARAYRLYSTGDPDNDYYNCFVDNPVLNPEYILSRSVWTTDAIEWSCSPCGFAGSNQAYGRTNPTQNLVDAYETKNGLPIDQDPTYDEQNPYANRDPRLEQTILHHGSIWGDKVNGEERAIDVCPTGIDYAELHGGTVTGYYPKKFVNKMSFKSPTSYRHACPIFRYGEILLNAAEAFAGAGNAAKAMEYVNQVRARVGMPPYSGLSGTALMERIQNERRIELVFEDHRFFDERRWKLFEGQTAASESNLPMYKQVYNLYGVTPSGAPNEDGSFNGSYSYNKSLKDPVRAFRSPKNYYFPIPDNEVKAVSNWAQNAGWELSSRKNDDSSEATVE